MTENQIEFVSKDVEDFAVDLYDYIWTKHRFRSKSLEKIFAEKLSQMIEEPKKVSIFDNNIGNAVLCSQYLLRGYCEFLFKCYEDNFTEDSNIFYVRIFEIIESCIDKRNSIFFKVIDSAAIIAEAFLFCDAKFNTVTDVSRASVTFKNYFLTFFQREFFEKGGWNKLKSSALEDYHNLYLDLKPYICSLQHPYGKLQHCCRLTRKLRESPVAFPFEVSMTCRECVSIEDLNFRSHIVETKLKNFMNDLSDGTIREEDLFQKISDLIKKPTADSSSCNEILHDKVHILRGIYLGKDKPALSSAAEYVERSESSMQVSKSTQTCFKSDKSTQTPMECFLEAMYHE